MQLEIKVALNFIISYLYNKLPRRRADLFGEELERLLKKKYEGHWYPDKPLKGSGTCNSSSFDMAQVFGGGANSLFLEKAPFVEGLSYNLNTMQYPSQPFQPVVLAN